MIADAHHRRHCAHHQMVILHVVPLPYMAKLLTVYVWYDVQESERDTPERTIESAFKQLQFCIERNSEQVSLHATTRR